jgi:3-phenylpropionate/trans-cinnamate dioxygenase ferredoxin reductase subunit
MNSLRTASSKTGFMMRQTDVLIVGAGHAGVECGIALRENGYAGSITLFGQESHLPYERPPLSKSMLSGDTDVDRIRLRAESLYLKHDIRLQLSKTVTSLDARQSTVSTSDGEPWSFANCVIATGATARSLPGASGEGVFSIRTLDDVAAMRRAMQPGGRLLVAGGGYLGLEAACTAARLGLHVTVLEQGASIMPGRVSPYTTAQLHELHVASGINIVTNCRVVDWRRKAAVWQATARDGTVYEGDLVLVAVGASPNITLAQEAGLACDGGILVQSECRTSAPNVFAIGDCAAGLRPELGRHTRLESVNNALTQARAVAAALTEKTHIMYRPPTFWSEQCGRRLQMAGIAEPGEPCEDAVRVTVRGWVVERHQAGTLRAIEAIDSPVEFMQGVKRIGSCRQIN